MKTIHSAAHLIQENYYMLKIDCKVAFYCLKIFEEHKKYPPHYCLLQIKSKYFNSTGDLIIVGTYTRNLLQGT